ncbi:hypothetical protein MP228_011596 [Amoeboaphelidium protococcarum]|nr:hypothetical protein MP228_011596 [Amoeboaphelidium protococcarum]
MATLDLEGGKAKVGGDKKITLRAILAGETSFPLTVDELRIYMSDISHDVENFDFMRDVVRSAESLRNYSIIGGINDERKSAFVDPKEYQALKLMSDNALVDQIVAIQKSGGNVENGDVVKFEALVRKANQEIKDAYIAPGSKFELNINSVTRNAVLQAPSNAPPLQLFAQCIKEVLVNIETNAIPRFVNYASNTNIGERESIWRRDNFVRFATAYIISIALLIGFSQPSLARLGLLPVCFLVFTTFWQWRSRFCVVLGRNSLTRYSNDKKSEAKQVFEACVLKSHAQRSREIYRKSIICMILLMMITLALPPYKL